MSKFSCHVHVLTSTKKPNLFFFNSADKVGGKKSARKTTRAGGSGIDLQKVAEQQQIKLEIEREEMKEQIKAAKAAAAVARPETPIEAPAVKKPVAKESEPGKYGWCNIYKTGC